MKQKELKTFYLLTLPPLFLFSAIILFFDPELIDAALFAYGYSFTLVYWTPHVKELILTKKYRMSFLRLSYSMTRGVIKIVNPEEKLLISSLIRIFLPMLVMLVAMFVLQIQLAFYYTFAGAILAELLLQVFKRYLPKNVLSFAV